MTERDPTVWQLLAETVCLRMPFQGSFKRQFYLDQWTAPFSV
jgi:hypothetical protein